MASRLATLAPLLYHRAEQGPEAQAHAGRVHWGMPAGKRWGRQPPCTITHCSHQPPRRHVHTSHTEPTCLHVDALSHAVPAYLHTGIFPTPPPPWHLHTMPANLHTDAVLASPHTMPTSPLRSFGKWETHISLLSSASCCTGVLRTGILL